MCCALLRRSVVYDSLYETWTVAGQAHSGHGILQARIPDWVDLPSSRGSSPARDQTQVSRVAAIFLTSWAPGEVWVSDYAHLKPNVVSSLEHRVTYRRECAWLYLEDSEQFHRRGYSAVGSWRMNRHFLATDYWKNTLRRWNSLSRDRNILSKVCLSNGESTGTTEIGGSYWNSLERQVGPDCAWVSRLGDLMFRCEGARELWEVPRRE